MRYILFGCEGCDVGAYSFVTMSDNLLELFDYAKVIHNREFKKNDGQLVGYTMTDLHIFDTENRCIVYKSWDDAVTPENPYNLVDYKYVELKAHS